MGLPSGRAAATSPSPPLSPTHPVSIRFAGGVRTRGDGELLLLHAVFTNGDRDSAALLRVATRRRQAARGADRDRAAMSTSRRRTLLKVIVLGDSGSAHCSLPPPPSPNPAPPSLPRIRPHVDFPGRCCDFQGSFGGSIWTRLLRPLCFTLSLWSDLVRCDLCRVGKTSLMNQYP